MRILKRVVFSVALLPLWAAGGIFSGGSGGTGGQIIAPPSGLVITNGGSYPIGDGSISGGLFIGGGAGVAYTNPLVTISGGTFSAPPGGWGLVVNDAELTISGGTFSSIALQYKTNGMVNATVSPDADIETGDGVWLGYYGSDSTLTVESNATLSSDQLFVGYTAPATSNKLFISSAGAVLNVREGVFIGGHSEGTNQVAAGTGNFIKVSGGGTLVTPDLNIYAGNTFDLNNGGTLAVRTNFNAATPGFNFNAGGTLKVGGELTGMSPRLNKQRTVILNGSRAVWDLRSTTLPGSRWGSVSDLQGTSGLRITAIGPEWVTSYTGDLFVGDWEQGSRLEIIQGARVLNRRGLIGANSAGSDHSVVVAGAGSLWKNDRALYLGGRYDFFGVESTSYGWMPGSVHSSLTVSNGGWVVVGDTVELPQWGSGILVGATNGSAEMVVARGSRVESGILGIGVQSNQTGSVIVKGAGTLWNQNGWVEVGQKGSGSELLIEAGVSFSTIGGTIGKEAGANENRIVVSGSNAVWNTRIPSQLVTGGTMSQPVDPGSGIPISITNFPPVIGIPEQPITPGTILVDIEALIVGESGANNRLDILDGGVVKSGSGWIGMKPGADSNAVVVAGTGSRWTTRKLSLGGAIGFTGPWVLNGQGWIDGGQGNSLTVSNGGWVQVGDIGTNRIPDAGSLGVIAVGSFDGSAEMVVANGSYVMSDLASVGVDPLANGSVTVAGAGSLLFSRIALEVEGNGSTLSVLQGGVIESGSGLIGYEAGSSSNRIVVSGEGSYWDSHVYSWGGLPPPRRPIDSSPTYSVIVPVPGWTGGVSTFSSPSYPIRAEDRYAMVNDFLTPAVVVDSRTPTVGSDSVSVQGLYVDPITGQPIDYDPALPQQKPLPVGNGDLFVGYRGTRNELEIADGGEVYNNMGFIGFFEEAKGNRVRVRGNGSKWYNSKGVFVGHDASGNRLAIENGGQVFSSFESFIGYGVTAGSNVVQVSGADSRWMNSSGLHVGYGGAENLLRIENGGFVESSSGIIGMWETANSNRVVVTGANSMWNNGYSGNPAMNSNTYFDAGGGILLPSLGLDLLPSSDPLFGGEEFPVGSIIQEWSNDLTVGFNGSYNTLSILDGASVSNYNGIIGESSNGWNNAVVISGTNSQWNNRGNLSLGGRISQEILVASNGWERRWIDGGRNNSLYVGDGGLVSVGRDMHNRNYSTVSVDPGGHVSITSNYYQDATSILRFGVETNAVGAPLNALVSVGGTAEFETGATLQYSSNVGVLEFDSFYTNLIVEANQLIVGGVTNATALDLDAINLDGSLVELMLWEQNQNIYGLVGRKHLAESAGFIPSSQMALVSGEIDALSVQGNTATVDQINQLNRMSGAQQNQQLSQLYTQGAPTYQHQQGMQGGQKQVLAQSRDFQAGNRASASQPTGAAGPHEVDQGLRGWMRGYGSWAERDESSSFSDFSQNVYGTVVGLDRTFGSVLLGVAGGYAYSDLTQENYDSSQAKTGYGVLYGSFGSTDWFGDLNFSYGRSRIETRSGTVFGANGTSDADHYSLYLGGGKEMSFADGNYLFTPEAALGISYFDQGGYSDGLREIDAYNRWSYQSRLGAAVAFPRKTASVVWKPEARMYWLHEFNTDFDQIGYSLIGGSGRYLFGMQAPVKDLVEAGIGLSATFNDRFEIVLNLDGQYSRHYEAITVGGRVSYEF